MFVSQGKFTQKSNSQYFMESHFTFSSKWWKVKSSCCPIHGNFGRNPSLLRFFLQKIWFSDVCNLTLDETDLSQHLSDWCWTQIVLASLILRPSSQVIYGSLPKVLRPLKARKGPQGQSRKVRVQIRLIFDSNTSQWTLEFWVRNTRRTFGTASLIKKKGPNLILKLST